MRERCIRGCICVHNNVVASLLSSSSPIFSPHTVVVDGIVDEGSEYDISVRIDRVVNDLGGAVYLLQSHVATADDVEDDPGGAVDGRV